MQFKFLFTVITLLQIVLSQEIKPLVYGTTAGSQAVYTILYPSHTLTGPGYIYLFGELFNYGDNNVTISKGSVKPSPNLKELGFDSSDSIFNGKWSYEHTYRDQGEGVAININGQATTASATNTKFKVKGIFRPKIDGTSDYEEGYPFDLSIKT
ncbi:putative secreted protein [Wickerhamomyces ciferrii]|uniref:Secreted protein n=1 Tax=Wickerhamomyces ciferrii (strain ATCC 14091 / BCRC 22168 / CBS 111 / JCM 3599 / NBRC 0793 / NRRL Y-1031 F-60-10) TaxID=1206466 RepID=K0KLV6_WICCF|nr:uncharacterized protein BN7_5836 [Wickerhamomyces ciferrii]CCH46245.1 putative secreted protein [Wickerhamomyces ciferrii]